MNWPPFHPAARAEFDGAVDYYALESKALARRLVLRTLEVIEVLREFPEAGSPIGATARRFSLHPFPHDLVYVPEGDDIFIYAFAHHRMRPEHWKARL